MHILLTPCWPLQKTKLFGGPFLAGSSAAGIWVRFFLCRRRASVDILRFCCEGFRQRDSSWTAAASHPPRAGHEVASLSNYSTKQRLSPFKTWASSTCANASYVYLICLSLHRTCRRCNGFFSHGRLAHVTAVPLFDQQYIIDPAK